MASPNPDNIRDRGRPLPSLPPLPPIPTDSQDLESGRQQLLRSPSRASLPRPQTPADDALADDEEPDVEFPWGPAHPCYPHMNVHVPIASPLYESTRLIKVKRDWMQVGDLAPTYANLYPEILDPLVSEEEFRKVVRHINDELIAAFNPTSARAWVDAVLGAATLWLYDDLGFPSIKKRLDALEKWIETWNAQIGHKEGVHIVPLRRTAYMTLDFQIPDPQISMDNAVSTNRPSTISNAMGTNAASSNPNFGPYPIPNVAAPHPSAQTHLPTGVSAH